MPDASTSTGVTKCSVCGVPLSMPIERCSFDGCPRMTTASDVYAYVEDPLKLMGVEPSMLIGPPMSEYEYKWENHAVYVRKAGDSDWVLFMYFPK